MGHALIFIFGVCLGAALMWLFCIHTEAKRFVELWDRLDERMQERLRQTPVSDEVREGWHRQLNQTVVRDAMGAWLGPLASQQNPDPRAIERAVAVSTPSQIEAFLQYTQGGDTPGLRRVSEAGLESYVNQVREFASAAGRGLEEQGVEERPEAGQEGSSTRWELLQDD